MAKALRAGLPASAPSLLASTRRVEAADGEVAGVHALDRVRRIDDLADLRAVGQEGDEIGPGVFPQADDRRVAVAPLARELVEAVPRGLLGLGGGGRSR